MNSALQLVATNPIRPRGGGKIRVLLIDGNTPMVDTLRVVFESHSDIELFHCSDPSSSRQVANRVRPTVILQTVNMPEVLGLDTVRKFRATAGLSDVPIVVLSLEEETTSREDVFSAGAHDYLCGLPDESELVARVRYHSRAYNEHLELQETMQDLETARNQMFQSAKMASIGMLAAGVAHEINNPVAFVTSNMNSLQGYYEDAFKAIDAYAKQDKISCTDSVRLKSASALKEELQLEVLQEDIGKIIDECKDGLSRVRNIVDNLSQFSRRGDVEWTWTDLHQELDRTLAIANNEIKYKADVSKEYGDLPEVQCIPSQFNQVILNLLINAAQAIETRGSITIRTHSGALPSRFRDVDTSGEVDANLDAWVCIQISDTGTGIDEDTLEHIFDAFFTTKEVGKGTGLGLSVSNGIIQGHGGHICAESELGRGTMFSVWLPIRQTDERAENGENRKSECQVKMF